MKNRTPSFWLSLAPYGVFFLLTLLWHMDLVLIDVDEAFYGAVIGQQSLWEFLVRQYATWSSRTVIEFFLCLFSSLPRLVWRLADSAVLLLLAVCLGRLAGGPAPGRPLRPRDSWLLVCLLWLYPWWYLSTAGWVATTMNYLWPLAGLCLAFVSLAGYGGRPGIVLGLAGLVYAVSAEQTLVLALLLLSALAVYRLAARRPLPRLFFGQLAVCAAGLVYMLLCPGLALRTENETISYYKDFGMRSLLARAEAGISGALGELFLDRNLLYALFFLLLAATVWQTTRRLVYRLLVLLPLGVELALGVWLRHYQDLVPALRDKVAALRGVGTLHVSNCNQPAAYLPFLLLCGCLAITCGCLYLVLGHTPRAYAALAVLLSGFATRCAIGFTPASAVSGERTGFLLAMAVAFCGVLLGQKLRLTRLWQKCLAAAILLPMAGVQFLSLWEI